MNAEILKKAEETVKLLKENGLTVASAESCTGGLVSAYITAVSGASEVFEAGITSYSSRIKNKLLSVDSDVLETSGAVCEETAKQMALNIKNIANADIGVSVTGVAGPGASEGHEPGYVFVGIAYKENVSAKLLCIEPLSREFVREQAVSEILSLIKKSVKGL